MERDFFPSKSRGQSDKEVPCLECKPTPATVRTSNITHTFFVQGCREFGLLCLPWPPAFSQSFRFLLARSVGFLIFCGVDKNRQKTTTGQIKNVHQKHTHIYPSIHQSVHIQARFVAELSPEMWQQLQVFVRASFALSKLQLKQGDKNGRFCVDAWPEIRRLWSRDDIYWFYAYNIILYSHADRCKDSIWLCCSQLAFCNCKKCLLSQSIPKPY